MNTCASYVTVCVIVVRFSIQYTCMYSVSVSVSQISVLYVFGDINRYVCVSIMPCCSFMIYLSLANLSMDRCKMSLLCQI